jgi:hypothetical protein
MMGPLPLRQMPHKTDGFATGRCHPHPAAQDARNVNVVKVMDLTGGGFPQIFPEGRCWFS